MDSRRADELDNDDRGASKRNTKSSGLPTAEDLLKPSDSLVSSVEESSFNDLFWDQIIKYAATAMIVLTLLDLLSSIREDTVQCMTPTNYTRDQGAFINSYCSQFTPPTVYFPFFLVGQATIIYGLHFLWFSWFSGKFHYFLSLATSLDRCRESKTGSYSLRNFVLCRALLGCFEGSKTITLFYILKLLLQLLLSGIFIYFSFEVEIFGNYSPPFVCPRSDNKIPETWPIGGYRVPCVLTSLNLLVAVRWLNVILLSGICFSALYGFVWCLWEHKSRLNWVLVADFSFLSGLPPYMYVPKGYKQFWKSWGQFCQYRIKDDFHFLVLKLYREDAGHAQVLREVLIDDFIRKREQRQFERLNLWKNLGKLSLVNELKSIELSSQGKHAAEEVDNSAYNCDEGDDLGNTLQSVLYNSLNTMALNLVEIDVLDIAFGTSGYKLQMAARSKRVVAVDLNPHYLNEEKPVCKKMYTAGIAHFKTMDNIFAKEKDVIHQFRDQLINEYCPLGTQPNMRTARANTILVGPIPASSTHGEAVPILDEHMANALAGPIPESGTRQEAVSVLSKRSRVVSIHWLLKWMEEHDLLCTKSYLVTVTPQTVEGKSVRHHFVEFKPDPDLDWK
jgi:hypothetical protein